jgi:hypothetical protein
MRSEGIDPRILNLGTKWKWSGAHPINLTPGKCSRYLLNGTEGGRYNHKEGFGQETLPLFPAGNPTMIPRVLRLYDYRDIKTDKIFLYSNHAENSCYKTSNIFAQENPLGITTYSGNLNTYFCSV